MWSGDCAVFTVMPLTRRLALLRQVALNLEAREFARGTSVVRALNVKKDYLASHPNVKGTKQGILLPLAGALELDVMVNVKGVIGILVIAFLMLLTAKPVVLLLIHSANVGHS
jgi:hypothetical protein